MGKDLNKGSSFVTVTGKAKITDKTFSGLVKSERTGYEYVRLNLGVETAEGNIIYGEMMGGYHPTNPIIHSMNKEDNTSLKVNWADRLNSVIVDSVSDFKLHKVGLERKEDGSLDIKKFLSPVDVEEYLKQHLTDGMEITVKGSYQLSEYKDETQRKFQIQNIFLPYQAKERDAEGKETGNMLPVQYGAHFIQTVLLTEDSFKKITKADAEAGEVVVSAQAVDYVSKDAKGKEVKKNFPFALPITVVINKENPAMTEKILNALFKVKKGVVREITIEGEIFEGYEKQSVNSKDIQLSPEIQELIAMGLYSEEEAKAKMTVRGNKVSKLVFTRPFLKKDKDDATKFLPFMADDKYAPEDLIVVVEENQDSIPDVVDQGSGTDGGDQDWMKALNLQ